VRDEFQEISAGSSRVGKTTVMRVGQDLGAHVIQTGAVSQALSILEVVIITGV